MSIEDYFDQYEWPDADEEPTSRTKECNRCGKSGLHWEELDEGWRLVDSKGKIHKCQQKPLDASEFL